MTVKEFEKEFEELRVQPVGVWTPREVAMIRLVMKFLGNEQR